MALLIKVRSATLIEALVATVLIVIVFIVASLIINNLLLNTFTRNTHSVEQRITELEYQLHHHHLKLPYKEHFGNWDLELKEQQIENSTWIQSTAVNRDNQKEVIKSRIHVK